MNPGSWDIMGAQWGVPLSSVELPKIPLAAAQFDGRG